MTPGERNDPVPGAVTLDRFPGFDYHSRPQAHLRRPAPESTPTTGRRRSCGIRSRVAREAQWGEPVAMLSNAIRRSNHVLHARNAGAGSDRELLGGLVALFAVGVWYRISSLDAFPMLDADEAWYALQLERIVRGEPFEARTPSGNPLTPFQAPVLLPLIALFGPSLGVIRAASVFAGLAAIVLTCRLGTRALDQTTALIAAALLAVLPYAITQSRTGYDGSQTVLYSVLLMYAAFRVRTVAVVVLLALSYYVHPTNLFAAPCVLAVYGVRLLGQDAGSRPGRPGLALRMAALAGVVGVLGLLTFLKPGAQQSAALYGVGLGAPHDPILFLLRLGRLFLASGRVPRPAVDVAFWSVVVGLVAFGLPALIRQRQWDRVALVASVPVGALGLFVVGGSNILQPGMVRYGLFLLVPSALAAGCLIRASLIGPTVGWRRAMVPLQYAALLGLGGLLLFSLDMGRLDWSRCVDGGPGVTDRAESIWTFRADRPDPTRQALRVIQRDRATRLPAGSENGRTPTVVICENGWVSLLLQFLTLGRDGVLLRNFDAPDVRSRSLGDLYEGGYAIALPGRALETLLRSVHPDGSAYRRFDVGGENDAFFHVYRLDRDPSSLARPMPGDYDGDGRAEPAVFLPALASWQPGGSNAGAHLVPLGRPGWIPAPADYNGDGRLDPVAYDPISAAWERRVVHVHPERFGPWGGPGRRSGAGGL